MGAIKKDKLWRINRLMELERLRDSILSDMEAEEPGIHQDEHYLSNSRFWRSSGKLYYMPDGKEVFYYIIRSRVVRESKGMKEIFRVGMRGSLLEFESAVKHRKEDFWEKWIP